MLFCHSLPYQDYSFTQLIQVFTFKNKPDISFVHYKLEIYIVDEKKCTFNKIPISWNHGARFKASSHFLHYFFSSYPTKMYVRCIHHMGLWSYLVHTKFMDTKSSDSFVYSTNYLYQFG